MMDSQLIGIGAALGSAVSWAIGSILFKRIGETVSSCGMTLAKGTISIVLLGVVLLINGYSSITINSFWLFCLSGILGITIADTLFFEALQDIGPIALIVFFMIGQMLTAVLAIFFLGEMLSFAQWFGVILTLAGICMVLLNKIIGNDITRKSGVRGIVLGGLSMIAMSFSTIIAKQALVSNSTLMATFLRMVAGTIGMLFLGIVSRRLRLWLNPVRDIRIMTRLTLTVTVVTFGGFWLSLVAIKYVDVAVASTISATEPLFLIPFAIIFLKERVSFMEIAGALLAISGIIVLAI